MARRILLCYDGSDGSNAALAAVARLFAEADVTVGHAWKPPLPYGGVSYGGQLILPPDIQREVEQHAREDAQHVAAHAVEQLNRDGISASAEVRETTGPVWRQLLAAADEVDADVIVAGSRGFGEVKALLLGSTSQALAHHARRPLMIVPLESQPPTASPGSR